MPDRNKPGISDGNACQLAAVPEHGGIVRDGGPLETVGRSPDRRDATKLTDCDEAGPPYHHVDDSIVLVATLRGSFLRNSRPPEPIGRGVDRYRGPVEPTHRHQTGPTGSDGTQLPVEGPAREIRLLPRDAVG